MASVQTASSNRPGLLVKLRPSRPWRIGPASAARDAVDLTYHSDTLYSALTHSMRLLGKLEIWLEFTARAGDNGSPIRFTSLYPFFGDTLYVPPPRHIWPPAPSVRVRYSGARFVPASLVESIFAGHPLQDDRWSVDGESECLVPSGRSGLSASECDLQQPSTESPAPPTRIIQPVLNSLPSPVFGLLSHSPTLTPAISGAIPYVPQFAFWPTQGLAANGHEAGAVPIRLNFATACFRN